MSASDDQLRCADLLVRACDCNGYRKETSLAASMLILRYFHGYYRGELCLLLEAKRKLVYRWIEGGRTESKRWMQAPYVLPSSESPPKTRLRGGHCLFHSKPWMHSRHGTTSLPTRTR